MKHIAILVPSFPIASETFVVTEIKALLNAGHKVTVLLLTILIVVFISILDKYNF